MNLKINPEKSMYNKVTVLEKIGWYKDAELTAHDKLTCLFNCMIDYFRELEISNGEIPNDIYVGGYYPLNPQRSFPEVIKKAHKFVEADCKSIDQIYTSYCDFLRSPLANEIASEMSHFLNGNLESRLIDEYIKQTY